MQPKGVRQTDPELYTRWLQSGVFTPIFKTHSTKDMTMEKRFWVFPDHFDPMRKAMRLRYDLSPYIYTAARQAYDTGVSICRPLYYYWPESDQAYEWKQQYMFGDDILATVICQPVDKVTGLAERTMWFPEGCDWYDMSTGHVYKGGTTHTLLYTIDENPYFVKAGAVIPMAGPDVMNLQKQSPELRLVVIPGAGQSKATVYEDDGESQAYDSEYAITEIVKMTSGGKVVLRVAPRVGSFKGMLENRKVSVVLEGSLAPSQVTVNGVEVPYSRYASYEQKDDKQVWGYNGAELQVEIWLSELPASEALEIECTFNEAAVSRQGMIFGKKGLIKRMMAITPEAKYNFASLGIRDLQLPAEFLNVAQCGAYMTEDPMNAFRYLEAIDIQAMSNAFDRWEKLPSDFKKKALSHAVFQK